MSKVIDKAAPGRQSQLPWSRAFKISFNSLKIRFWRSVITAGGIFLGIAFFTVVLTQNLMQWPVPEKVDAGFFRISGQVASPNDYEVWKAIPVEEGLKAGIPQDVLDRASRGKSTFQLARIVQGQINEAKATKKLALLKSEWKGMEKIKPRLTFFMDAMAGKDMKTSDAIKWGVPRKVVKEIAGRKKTFVGTDLADKVREDSSILNSFDAAVLLDQDISIRDGVDAGVPETVAKKLAAGGNTFKAAPLNDAITGQPDQIKIYQGRADRNRIYTEAKQSSIDKLDRQYAITLDDALAMAKGFAKDARKAEVKIVDEGRKIKADLAGNAAKDGSIKLRAGDVVYVPDSNSYYRMWWLIIMSLLVCGVGITNSMLMSVTERFKEIGTMKCLGALDSFVVRLFMLESGMMGVVASALGWAVGFFSIVLLAGFTKGWDIVANMQFLSVLGTLVLAMGVGLVLTIAATIAPAMRAASMPAAMALRSEI